MKRRKLPWRQGVIWKEEEWINWSTAIIIYEIPKSSNILQSSNSINVTLVARVMAREHYFVYYADDETTFTLLDWNISYISGHIMLETGCSFIKMHGRTCWIVIASARRGRRRIQQLTIPDQRITIFNFRSLWALSKLGLLPDAYLHLVRKRPLISDHLKGPLVATFRSPMMKALDRSVEMLGLWIVTSSVTIIKSANQSSIKLCLIVHLVAVWTLIHCMYQFSSVSILEICSFAHVRLILTQFQPSLCLFSWNWWQQKIHARWIGTILCDR